MLVVEGVLQAPAVRELDDALPLPRHIHVGVRHLSGRSEEVLQVLVGMAKCVRLRHSLRRRLTTLLHSIPHTHLPRGPPREVVDDNPVVGARPGGGAPAWTAAIAAAEVPRASVLDTDSLSTQRAAVHLAHGIVRVPAKGNNCR